MIEFTLVGIPAIIICTCVLTCTTGLNNCPITRAEIATYFQNQAIALDPASTTMVLDDGSGAVTCNPVSSCPSSASRFPAAGHNSPTTPDMVSIQATYQLINPIFMFWPGAHSVSATRFTVGATSQHPVVF